MATLKQTCPKCSSAFVKKMRIGKDEFNIFICGHLFKHSEEPLNAKPTEPSVNVESFDVNVSDKEIKFTSNVKSTIDLQDEIDSFINEGNPDKSDFVDETFYSLNFEKKAYQFQIDGIKFAEGTKLICLIADEMGLGKTVQGLLIARRNDCFPLLIVVKGATTLQWCKEIKTWLNDHPMGVMPIMNRDCIIAGFSIYVISMDFISRKGVKEKLDTLKIRTLIVDECQAFKDASSKRTVALIKLIQDNKIQNRIFLSGTPIKNRANEYFTILNLLAPHIFHSYASFCKYWLIPNEKGVYTRIDPQMVDMFHEKTSKWIIRREKKDVLKNLPPLVKDYQLVEIEDELIKKSYNHELDMFSNFLNSGQKFNSTVLLGWLAKLRAITGQAKIPWVIDFTNQMMNDTDNSLAIGIHHHAVRDRLHFQFTSSGFDPLKLSGEDDVFKKDRIQRDFNEGKNRLLIINAIAGGVGLNLQSCSNCVLLERQWNPADEEQFFARFHRDGQKKSVTATIPIATGTIDEWFHDLVEKVKRPIVNETMGASSDSIFDVNLLKELAEMSIQHRL